DRHVVRALAVAEERRPSGDVRTAVPDADPIDLMRRHRRITIVEHRVDQQLTDQLRTLPVTGAVGELRSESVLDRDDDSVESLRPVEESAHAEPAVADDHAAAVRVEEPGAGARAAFLLDHGDDDVIALVSGDRDVPP